jgi:hypothetical protein
MAVVDETQFIRVLGGVDNTDAVGIKTQNGSLFANIGFDGYAK